MMFKFPENTKVYRISADVYRVSFLKHHVDYVFEISFGVDSDGRRVYNLKQTGGLAVDLGFTPWGYRDEVEEQAKYLCSEIDRIIKAQSEAIME